MNEKLPGIRPKENRNLKNGNNFIYAELLNNTTEKNGK